MAPDVEADSASDACLRCECGVLGILPSGTERPEVGTVTRACVPVPPIQVSPVTRLGVVGRVPWEGQSTEHPGALGWDNLCCNCVWNSQPLGKINRTASLASWVFRCPPSPDSASIPSLMEPGTDSFSCHNLGPGPVSWGAVSPPVQVSTSYQMTCPTLPAATPAQPAHPSSN